VKEHHQAYIALCLTLGEFTAAAKMLFDGHLLTMYLALTYLARETSGGKHYHDIVVRWVEKTRRDRQCAQACAALKKPVLSNPFGGK
jgi:hypothetical protein